MSGNKAEIKAASAKALMRGAFDVHRHEARI
jgi:hypothetical protein